MRPVVTFVVLLVLSVSPVFAGPLKWFAPSGGCPNGSCPVVEVPVTVEVVLPVEKEPTIDEAARRLAKGGLKPAEEKKLAKIIDAPALKKALRQEWSIGSREMLCRSGGSVLYDVLPDGTKKPAAVQPAEAPEEGVHGREGFRFFRRRR